MEKVLNELKKSISQHNLNDESKQKLFKEYMNKFLDINIKIEVNISLEPMNTDIRISLQEYLHEVKKMNNEIDSSLYTLL